MKRPSPDLITQKISTRTLKYRGMHVVTRRLQLLLLQAIYIIIKLDSSVFRRMIERGRLSRSERESYAVCFERTNLKCRSRHGTTAVHVGRSVVGFWTAGRFKLRIVDSQWCVKDLLQAHPHQCNTTTYETQFRLSAHTAKRVVLVRRTYCASFGCPVVCRTSVAKRWTRA